MPISPTLPHCTPRALCGSIEKNIDSLVKGMTLFDQGGGGIGEREKGHGQRAPPRQSMVHLFFVVVCTKVFF
jgi:hypothetical protein